jgi:predicted HTH domain antitoxin
MYIVFNTIISFIQNINTTLDKLYKKRNVSTDEYLTIIKDNDIIYKQYQHINDIIWSYTLFETNENINKIKYKESEITIDIRIFKRYINIFSFSNVSKLLKISTENLIKNEIKNRIVLMQNNLFIKNVEDSIEQLTYDLGDVWSCMKS